MSSEEILYPDFEIRLCTGEEALTADQAKELLGWQEEEKGFGTKYLLKDQFGTKIRCHHNVSNRPLYENNVAALKQEMVRGQWRFNGEPIIISKTGKVLNGQHQMIALVLAHQDWQKDLVEEEPVIDKLIVFGVDDDDRVVNTMDTGKPRSLSDVLYRSEYFADASPGERKRLARAAQYAVATMWSRLGRQEAYLPRQTHSEAIDFLERHPRLIECIEFLVVEEGANQSISKYVSVGYASALMYLMATSKSDPSKYEFRPCEESLDFSNWDKAQEFFVQLSSGGEKMKSLQSALGQLLKQEEVTRKERVCLVIKAWLKWVTRKKLSGVIKLQYEEKDGVQVLVEDPSVGGIDLLGDDAEGEEE